MPKPVTKARRPNVKAVNVAMAIRRLAKPLLADLDEKTLTAVLAECRKMIRDHRNYDA
jgi:hypothetical protein